MHAQDLDFDLPAELVAQHPVARRDACRLAYVVRDRPDAQAAYRFDVLPELLRPGDVLVRNVSRVLPARLRVTKSATAARGEVLLVEPHADGSWWCLTRPAKRLRPGTRLQAEDGSTLEIVEAGEAGWRRVRALREALLDVAHRTGRMPLPPYIRREATPEDDAAYQTVYARDEGSVAAPTAGLHFTPELLQRLERRGVAIVDLTLHVGPGTFEPMHTTDPEQHVMHAERFAMPRATWEAVQAARRSGRRVVAVGTTAVRTLESLAAWEVGAAGDAVDVEADADVLRGRTRLFIHPPWPWRCTDVLLTNFHLPRSTLLLLVQAFAGVETVRTAYARAIAARWRFFSYGDAMLIAAEPPPAGVPPHDWGAA